MATDDKKLPMPVRRALAQLGRNISIARRRRGLTIAMMAERIGVAVPTYQRVERGEAGVAISTYLTAMMVLGRIDAVAELFAPERDHVGTLLANDQLPQRVRPKRDPQPK